MGSYRYIRPTWAEHENRPKSTYFLQQAGGDEDFAFLWNSALAKFTLGALKVKSYLNYCNDINFFRLSAVMDPLQENKRMKVDIWLPL